MRSYSDDQLGRAVAASHSWRGVLRELGLHAGSAGSMRSVQRHAERLGLDHAHFTGGRRWSDAELTAAVGQATSWSAVAALLGLSEGGGALASLRAHAARLQLPVRHLDPSDAPRPTTAPRDGRLEYLRNAGSLLAATWYSLRGASVSWPLEPCRYDLIVDDDAGRRRVQVKTSTLAGPNASVHLANSRDYGKVLYAPDEIDEFFVVDGALNAYVLPYSVVVGKSTICPSAYLAFRVVAEGRLTAA